MVYLKASAFSKNEITRKQLTGIETTIVFDIMPSINAITLYKGKPPLEYLKNKLSEIVQLNPWLEGWLIQDLFGERYVEYFTKPSSLRCFSVIDDYTIKLPDNYENGFFLRDNKIAALKVKTGRSCLNNPHELLFKVMIIPCHSTSTTTTTTTTTKLDESIYAIWVSMSHSFADGYTFYKIQNMLSMDMKAEAMIFDRITNFSDRVYEQPYTVKKWMITTCVLFRVLWTIFQNLIYPIRQILNMRQVSNHIINLSKKYHQLSIKQDQSNSCQRVNFISTNDILTSSYFNSIQCDIGMVSINFRNRLKDITDYHAGNYETMLVYTKHEFQTPMSIRQTLLSIDNQETPPPYKDLDLGFSALTMKIGLITNWSSFYHDIILPNSELILHMPLIDKALTNGINGPLAIIFRANKYKLMIWTQLSEPMSFDFEVTSSSPTINSITTDSATPTYH